MSKPSTGGRSSGGAGEVGNDGDDDWRKSLNRGDRRSKKKSGILRLDISKPRRSSGGSVEFRPQPEWLGEDTSTPSGPASPHQLSVTWASQCDLNDTNSKTKQMLSHLEPLTEKGKRSQEDKPNDFSANLTSPPLDAVVGEQHQPQSDGDDDDDEEYSISVSAIMQRRASVRGNRKRGSRNSRRASSPMDHVLDTVSQTGDRRRSSVYTTSSGDTAISVDDGTNQDSTQEQIYENIRLHKEVIQSVKLQPWNIRKKLKLVRQAKTYVARHEGALQERFALSRSLRDLWARFKILMAARWRHWKRETSSFLTVLIPWELRIKEIESHFGSGVASYFTFLRWLLWVNIMMTIPLIAFVIAPEVLSTNPNEEDPRKKMSEREMKVAGNLFTIWEFEGYLKYSPLFYGYYSSKSGAVQRGYNLPLAYFLTAVAVYVYSFVATLRKMAENSRNSKLSSKDDECIFSWKLFTGWDFMIGHAETAHNRIASVVVGFKEALLEEAEKKKDKRNWRIILQRILVNILVIGLLAASGYTVVSAVDRSENIGNNASWFRRNEVNVIMTLLSFFLPMLFDALGLFENWHPRQQLRLQLARIMILNLLNLYSLMFSFIYKITGKDESLQLLKEIDQNATTEKGQIEKMIASLILTTAMTTPIGSNSNLSDSAPSPTSSMSAAPPSPTSTIATHFSATTMGTLVNLTRCFTIRVNCSVPKPSSTRTLTTASMLLLNLSTTMLPNLWTSPLSTSPTVLTTPYDDVTTTIDFLTSTTDFNEAITSPGSSSVDPFTGDDWSSTPTELYSTTPQQTSTTEGEDYRSEFNATYFDYQDYFDNFDPISEYDATSSGGTRQRRSVTDSAEDSSASSVNSESTEFTSTFLWENSTAPSSTFESSTDPTDEVYTADMSTATTLTSDDLIETMPTIVSLTETSTEDDKTHEYTATAMANTEITTAIETTISSAIVGDVESTHGANGDKDEDSCWEMVCITLPPELCTTPQPIEVPSSTTAATSLSTITTLTPVQQMEYHKERLKNLTLTLENVRRNLTSMCWETSLGQELSKVIVFDMIMSIVAPLCIDFLRALFVRYMNKYWCWDMEKTFPQYGDFKIAESILNLVYNQGQVWMGIFFSPGLVIINFVKLMILMYLRSWIVLTCNVPHEVVFKASKSNNFYLSLLLTMLFLCVLPVGYAIVWLRPSWHCGPFSDYDRISEFFTNTIINALPPELHKPLEYMTSPSTVIPLLLLLTLIIYYLVSLTGALREANQDLRNQLQKEREEERKKMFKLPETKSNEQATTALTNRWRKVLEASSPLTPTAQGQQPPDFDEASKNQARKELIARIMKKALRKGSATSDDESYVRGRDEDDTDTEHHESLPHDEETKEKMFGLSKLQNIRRTRKPSLVDIVQIAKSEQNKMKESHPRGRFKVDKVDKIDKAEKAEKGARPERGMKSEKSVDVDNDPETNSRVVSERRMSLLRKQSEESEAASSKPADPSEAVSKFAIVNEKATDTLRKHKRKPPSQSTEPDVFKFDEKSVERSRGNEEAKSGDATKKRAEPADKTKPMTATTEEEKHDAHKHERLMNLSKQGRKKIGSFMSLVREAVKKVEANALNGEPSTLKPPSTDPDPAAEPKPEDKPEQTFVPKPEPKPAPLPEKVDPPPTNDAEEDDQPGPIPLPIRSGSLRWVEKPTPIRQDSQTSVWSDNIPTITISTTGSEECILEGGAAPAEGHAKDAKPSSSDD